MGGIQKVRLGGLNGHMILPDFGVWAESAVFMLHGYGADGYDMIGLAQEWAPHCPRTIFFAPDAPYPCDMSPMGRQWFPLGDMDMATMQYGIRREWQNADHFINAAMEEYNIPDYRAVIGGFSQGCMMALHVAFQRDEPCAGVLGYSGMLLDKENLNRPRHRELKIHLIHGENDPVVPVECWDDAVTALKHHKIEVTGYKGRNLGHGIDGNGVESGLHFIRRRLEY